jgi:hypothetical protein
MDAPEILDRTILSKEANMASLESENDLNKVGRLAGTDRAPLPQERQETGGQRYDAYRHWGLNE